MALDYWHRYGTDTVGVDMMIDFCKKYEEIYIYGCDEEQSLLAKYLENAEMPIKGFLTSWCEEACQKKDRYKYPLYWIEEFKPQKDIGILISVKEQHYNDIVHKLISLNLLNFFFVNELNRFAIAQKMRPADKRFFWFEMNVVEHCNLNCQMCDHFSPIADPGFIKLEEMEKQIKRMADLMDGEIRAVKIEGGEPLMHPQINEILQMVRKHFHTGIIYLYTNGMLLPRWEKDPRGNLWKTCKECHVDISVTEYPINLDYGYLRYLAKKYGVNYNDVTSRNKNKLKFSFHHPFDLEGKQEPYHFINCFCFNNCITLRDGKMYPCSMMPNSHHFNKYFGTDLKITEADYIDIYKANSFEEIAEFIAKRPSFCRYCNVKERKAYDWEQSKKDMNEWTSRNVGQ